MSTTNTNKLIALLKRNAVYFIVIPNAVCKTKPAKDTYLHRPPTVNTDCMSHPYEDNIRHRFELEIETEITQAWEYIATGCVASEYQFYYTGLKGLLEDNPYRKYILESTYYSSSHSLVIRFQDASYVRFAVDNCCLLIEVGDFHYNVRVHKHKIAVWKFDGADVYYGIRFTKLFVPHNV